MTGRFWLDWAMLAASLFNTIVLLWLGLTVLLNANRRAWGVWWMGGGLLVGAVFFISHSAILGQELGANLDGLNFWWRVAWFPVVISPFAWYVAVLWFSGYWAAPRSRIRRRHRVWLWLLGLWLLALVALLLAANPTPTMTQLIRLELGDTLAVHNVPLFLLLFPLWIVACIGLSLDALPRAAADDDSAVDANTQLARQRARPWLLGTALALLVVSLVVAAFIAGVVADLPTSGLPAVPLQTVALYDLALSLLIALATLLLGQAIVSYEIFTGRVLPRRSFARHWRNAIILAGGYALVVGWSIAVDLRPIYSLLLATLLLTFFYALYGWRSFGEREQFVAQLRPFVQSQGLTLPARHAGASAGALLAALSRDVLGTAHAQIIPLGSMAPLVTTPLCYPADTAPRTVRLPDNLGAGMIALDAATYTPYRWGIALWDERGRIGALLIGEKQDRGLYSQEEMETAQAAGERIVHLLAGEEMVRRLMELQRKRTAEQRVMDLRTRRALHDEILPALHLAVLQLGRANRQHPAVQETLATLAEVHHQIAALLTGAQPAPARSPDPCELVSALRALVANDFAHSFDELQWRGFDADQRIYVDEMVGEVVLGAAREVMRNAAAHGRGEQADRLLRLELTITASGERGEINLILADNGVGIDAGPHDRRDHDRGHGLALHSTLLAMVDGYLTLESRPAGGTEARITVPALVRELAEIER